MNIPVQTQSYICLHTYMDVRMHAKADMIAFVDFDGSVYVHETSHVLPDQQA